MKYQYKFGSKQGFFKKKNHASIMHLYRDEIDEFV